MPEWAASIHRLITSRSSSRAVLARSAALVLALIPIAGGATADLITSGEAFLDRQLDKFALPGDYPVSFETARLIQTYDVPPPQFMGTDHPLAHRADVYDSALALIAFIEADDLVRAMELADGLRLVQATDPIGDGRLRASYYANDLLAPGNTGSSIDSPDARVGNLAWAGIALTRFFHAATDAAFLTEMKRTLYLDSSRDIASWIIVHTQQDDAFGGFSLGEDASGNPLFGTIHARSTEHNLDVFVLAQNLAFLDPADSQWPATADHAGAFVQLMFEPSTGRYRTGTRDNGSGGIEINPTPIPADAQTWTALSGVDTTLRRAAALRFIADTPLGDPFALLVEDDIGDGRVYWGLRFSTGGDHIQVEETGGYAMALSVGTQAGWLVSEGGEASDKWTSELGAILASLDDIRLTSPGADPGGIGIVATPWPAGAFSGFEGTGAPPTYSNLRHVASTVWPALATRVEANDSDATPLRPLPEPSAALTLLTGCVVLVALRQCTLPGRTA
jgi:hypothetical protein